MNSGQACILPNRTGIIIFLLMGVLSVGKAQISPGELTKAHAQLEGMLNCTKCHDLGDKVSNAKCMDCHKEIKSRVDQKKGYHSSSGVIGKDCFSCHSEHHGRNFEIVRFDTDQFNHELTGYKLTGAHLKQDCVACHKDERIESAELRKKEKTYLGIKTECKECHKDVHRNTLSTDCASCHTTEAFIPATLFNHAKTDFPLKGKHKDVDCKRCHEITFSNSALFQQFSGVPFNTCAVCHEDVHKSKFGTNCKECHNEESFTDFGGKGTFNHGQTGFPLLGKHKSVDCATCHKMGENIVAENAFKDYKGKDVQQCITCHQDVHESKLGADCRKCHTEESFQKILNVNAFEHGLTGYPLEGKHQVVDCKKCHLIKATDPVKHELCSDCHIDFHKGQFVQDTHKPDCKECHTVEGFSGSLYTIEKHNEGPFPLSGAHLATPCLACHLKNEEWTFRDIGNNCAACHDDVHEGFLSEKYYPRKSCESCHSPEGWAQTSFDHLLTGFELQGKHNRVACVECHKPDPKDTAERKIPFSGLKTDCYVCHANIHEKQFDVEGVTDCRRCHGNEAWKPSQFDHRTARFLLDGAHKKVACKECHKEEIVDGKAFTLYRIEQFECATCHK